MAGIDTSIYSNFLRAPKSVAEYDAEAQAAEQNKLTLQMGRMKADEYTRGIADQNKLRGIVAGFGADQTANQNMLLKAGLLDKAQSYGKSNADIAKTAADAGKVKVDTSKTMHETAAHQFEIAGQLAASWATNPAVTKQQILSGLSAAAGSGVISPEIAQAKVAELAQLPEAAQALNAWAKGTLQQVMKAKDSMSFITPDANTVANNTQSNANSLRTAASSKYSADSSAASARRGQDMTDSRTREFNATRVEENTIKREAKDDVNKMTRSSQIASFDTMLGTLDRLSKHAGLSRSVGLTGKLPTMPGSDSANFQAELDTFQSQAFIPMVSQLKGMGALSDAEGRKLTAAVGALNPRMGEQAFRDSISRITADMEAAKKRLQGVGVPQASAGGVPDDIAALLTKHGGKK